MKYRYDKILALKSWVFPAILYLGIVVMMIIFIFPKFYLLHYETLLVLSLFAVWRYGWMFINYMRAFLYANFAYPSRKKRVNNIPERFKYPHKLYLLIPSYKEDFWVSAEVFRALFSEIASIPSEVVMVVATATKEEDELIQKIYDTYKSDKKITLIFQHQNAGKRIAMGHGLRAIAREYHDGEEDKNSMTIFMDGDSYMEKGFLKKLLPFFAEDSKLGAVTTNEVAYIKSDNKWYKDWFNLKFGQRHILFQAHSLSKKVMTLTGRLSAYRTKIVVQEDFISLVENDILTSPIHGKFRFLMGDDKTTWFYLLKAGWDMLYLPDLLCISLESRDGKFLELSRSLPYRWFGNTLRNNTRALKLGPLHLGWYIWYAILDQRLIMWTSLVGVSSAVALGIFSTWYYLFFFVAWIFVVRIVQLFVIALGGHKVSWRMPLLLIYTQWMGAFTKIKAYYNLSDQQWSKNGEKQKMDNNQAHIDHPLVPWMPKIMIATSVTLFITTILLSHQILKIPKNDFLPSFPFFGTTLNASGLDTKTDAIMIDLAQHGINHTRKDNAKIINQLIASHKGDRALVLQLPKGDIPLYQPIMITRSNTTLKGAGIGLTKLISYIKSDGKAVISIKGEERKHLGKLPTALYKHQGNFNLPFLKNRPKYLLIREPNSDAFLAMLGSQKWHKKYPYLRQEIIKVIAYDTQTKRIDIEHPILTDFDAKKSEVIALDMVENVTVEDLTIKQMRGEDKIERYRFVYKNSAKDIKVDAISMAYASKCNVAQVRLLQSGSHAIACQFCYGINLENLNIDGSWNKGKKGHGYVRFARTFHSRFHDSKVKNIRHVTLQWSSCGNAFKNLFLEVDVNLHGGFAHDNSIQDITFSIPKSHNWKPIEICPPDASWAPPDGKNEVLYESFKYNKGSKK